MEKKTFWLTVLASFIGAFVAILLFMTFMHPKTDRMPAPLPPMPPQQAQPEHAGPPAPAPQQVGQPAGPQGPQTKAPAPAPAPAPAKK